jgi:alpha/beta superfamily hydrolase
MAKPEDIDLRSVHDIPGAVGPLEVLFDSPSDDAKAVVVFAHPLPTHGGTMHTKMVFQGAKGLARAGCLVMRFNFRGVGRSAGTWDHGRGEQDDFVAALDYVARAFPGRPIWSAGASFGASIALTVGAVDPRVRVLIGVALPVELRDFSALLGSTKPKFLIHGEEDELISIRKVREFYARLSEPKELVVIERANHLFDGQASEVGDALEDLLRDFDAG